MGKFYLFGDIVIGSIRIREWAILAAAAFLVIAGGFFVAPLAFATTPGDVVINEFVSNPSTGNEWVELLNTTELSIDLAEGSGWTIRSGVGAPLLLSSLGTIPAQGIVVLEQPSGWLDDSPITQTITLFDGIGTPIHSVSYGSDPEVDIAAPVAGESDSFNGINWLISSAPTKGWFNNAEAFDCSTSLTSAPTLSSIATCLSISPAGIITNIGTIDNPSATPTSEPDSLYFQVADRGKIVFNASLNLSDQATVAILQTLGEKMEMSDRHIKFDSATADAMAATGAKIYMYGLDAFGYTSAPNLIVKNDAGNTLSPEDPDYPDISVSDYSGGTLTFTTDHFTQFDVEDLASIASADPAEVSGDFSPEINSSLGRGISAYLGRTTNYTGNPLDTIKWKVTITGPEGETISPYMIDLDEVGFLDTLSPESNIATYHYPFFEEYDENDNVTAIVATGSCDVAEEDLDPEEEDLDPEEEDLDPEEDNLHNNECTADASFSLDADDIFTNADKIIFDSDAPTGAYTITYELMDTNSNSVLGTHEVEVNVVDATAPTVTKLGDDSADVSLNAGDTYLIFSEVLSDSSKISVENALSAGADKSLTYYWDANYLIITAADITTFSNDVVVNVSDIAGNTVTGLLIIDSSLASTQKAPDSNGTATIDSTTPQVVITNPTQVVNLTIDSGTTDPTIDVSAFITGGTGTLPAITITSANAGNVNVAVPSSTVVTSADTTWNGIIAAPTVTTVTLPETSGETKTLSTAIEVGFTGAKLSFDKAVRILLPGQAGKRAGYVRTGVNFTEITSICSADSQTTGDALVADGDCKIDVGSDLVIWTKHFTSFATYTQSSTLSSSSGGSGGGGPGPIGAIAAGFRPAVVAAVPATPTIVSVGQVLGAAKFNFSNNLGLGSRGDDVTELQNRLVREGVYNHPITGFFGPLTKAGVKAFQKKYGIDTVGTVGPATMARLNSPFVGTPVGGQVLGVSTISAETQAKITAVRTQLVSLITQLLELMQDQVTALQSTSR
ncbi:MAG: peptidoglycan-binding protein [Patescibacteria group bacterium]